MAKSSPSRGPAPAPAADVHNFDRRLIIAAGAKGSSGKSTALLNLVDWYRQHAAQPVIGVFDPDTGHRTLTRALSDKESPARLEEPHVFEVLDWRNADEKHVVIDRVLRVLLAPVVDKPQPVVSLLDGVANQMDDVMLWARGIRLFEMAREMNFRVTFLLCVDAEPDSTNAAVNLVREVKGEADYVIVRNLKGPVNSVPFDRTSTRTQILEEMKGGEVTILPYTFDLKLFCSPDSGSTRPPASLFTASRHAEVLTRRRALTDWTRLSEEFDTAARLLLPPQCLSEDGGAQ